MEVNTWLSNYTLCRGNEGIFAGSSGSIRFCSRVVDSSIDSAADRRLAFHFTKFLREGFALK